MQTILRTIILGAILAVTSSAALAAEAAAGTWQLNLAKSKFSNGRAPQSQTRSYVESSDGLTLTLKTVTADGKATTVTTTFKEDGKPYPISGSPDFDTVSVKRVNHLTTRATEMLGGKIVGRAVRTVSKDGKVLIFSARGTDASGAKYADKSVYDRQ